MTIGASAVLLLIAVVLNVVAAFGLHRLGLTPVQWSELGIASGFAAFLVPDRVIG